MITFFLEDLTRARWMAERFLTAGDVFVDGPFRGFEGGYAGGDARVYVVDQGTEAAYAAGRLAARRGAEALIPIAGAEIHGQLAEEAEIMAGSLVPVEASWDLASLEPLLRLLPDSSPEFPLPLADYLPRKPVWRGEETGFAAGSLPFAVANPYLAAALHRQLGINLLDRRLSGYASAAMEEKISFRPVCFVSGLLTARGPELPSRLSFDKRLDEALDALLSE